MKQTDLYLDMMVDVNVLALLDRTLLITLTSLTSLIQPMAHPAAEGPQSPADRARGEMQSVSQSAQLIGSSINRQ